MADGVVFDRGSAKRIASVVRRVEGTYRPGAGGGGTDDKGKLDTYTEFVCKIDSHASGGGKYWLKELKPNIADTPATGNLTAEELGTLFTPLNGAKILGLNVPEVGKSTHALDVGMPVLVIFRKWQKDANVMEVIISAYGLENC